MEIIGQTLLFKTKSENVDNGILILVYDSSLVNDSSHSSVIDVRRLSIGNRPRRR